MRSFDPPDVVAAAVLSVEGGKINHMGPYIPGRRSCQVHTPKKVISNPEVLDVIHARARRFSLFGLVDTSTIFELSHGCSNSLLCWSKWYERSDILDATEYSTMPVATISPPPTRKYGSSTTISTTTTTTTNDLQGNPRDPRKATPCRR